MVESEIPPRRKLNPRNPDVIRKLVKRLNRSRRKFNRNFSYPDWSQEEMEEIARLVEMRQTTGIAKCKTIAMFKEQFHWRTESAVAFKLNEQRKLMLKDEVSK